VKQTSADREFARMFGEKLRPHYTRLVEKEGATMSAVQFAGLLGVSHGPLPKYLDGKSMPSLRTLVRAYDEFGIVVPYEGRSIAHLLRSTRGRKRKASADQLTPPLTITAEEPSVALEVAKKTAVGIKLELRFRKSSSR
jgi:transcriptional regulator with XRE-family HTH domain